MAEAIDIPAALRDEITADLTAGGERTKRWQPAVEGPLLLLASDGWLYPDQVVYMQFDHGPVCLYGDNASIGVATPGFWLRHAWAPVGGVDSGPRPDIGDRIIIRDVRYPDIEGAAIGQVATVDEIDNLTGRVAATLSDGRAVSYATRWAILPPAPTEPAAELEPAADVPTELASPQRERGRAIRDAGAGGIPDGPWRVGGNCPRNLWIGGSRPDGVDVGRMDTPELAAYVVRAVNERDRFRGHSVTLNSVVWKLAEVLGDVSEGQEATELDPVDVGGRAAAQLVGARAERDRYQRALEIIASGDPKLSVTGFARDALGKSPAGQPKAEEVQGG